MAVIRACVAIFFHCAAKFRHGYQYDIGHTIAHTSYESRKRGTELTQDIVQLTIFVAVVIPPSDIGECNFHSGIRFDESRDLLQSAAEVAGVLSTVGRRIWTPVDGF